MFYHITGCYSGLNIFGFSDFGIIGATLHTLSPLIPAGFCMEYWYAHRMDRMFRDIRYLPKVTQLQSDVEF